VRGPAASATDPDPAGHDAFEHDVVPVALRDPDSLDSFIAGTDLLVNCLGPGYRTRGHVAAAAQRRRVSYLDPNGDDAIHERIEEAVRRQPVQVAMLTGVGAVPGAFGLLARWLAATMPEPVRSVAGYLVTIEPMHPGTAAEFLLGLLDRRTTATAWHRGRRSQTPAGKRAGFRLPYVDCDLDGHPHLTRESEALAADLGLRDAVFYHSFESGGASLRYLEALGDRVRAGGTIRDLAAEMAATANEDMARRTPVQLLAFEVRSGDLTRSAVLRSASSYQLTAGMVVLAARHILARRVAPGLARADVLPPGLVTDLPGLDPLTCLEVQDRGLDAWEAAGGAPCGVAGSGLNE
jgi:hypothetical protein